MFDLVTMAVAVNAFLIGFLTGYYATVKKANKEGLKSVKQ